MIAFGLKIVAGIGMGILYSSYYNVREEADIYKYFDDSKILYDALILRPSDGIQAFLGNDDNETVREEIMHKMNHWYRPYNGNQSNDSHLMIRFNTLMRFISFGHYEVHVVFMSFISLLGLLIFYSTFLKLIPFHNVHLLKLLFFIPSVLIWSSSVLKEGFVILALGILVHGVYEFHKNVWKSLLSISIACVLLIGVKFYVVLAFVPGWIAYLWVNQNQQYSFLKYITVLLFTLGIATNLRYLGNSFDILQLIAIKQKDFICLAQWVGSGSYIELIRLDGTLMGTLLAIPSAMFNVIFKPLPWEASSSLMILAMLENWIWLVTFLYILWRPIKLPMYRRNSLLLWSVFILLLFVLIGITTPVMGAIVRYKVPAWPFAIVILCNFTSENKLKWISKVLQRI